MPSYTPLQAASKNQEDEGYEEVAVTNPATGISRRQLILFLLCMTASLVFGVDLGWQLGAHYATKEEQLSRASGLLSGCMKLSTFHICITTPCLKTYSSLQISAELRQLLHMTGYTPKFQLTNPTLHGK